MTKLPVPEPEQESVMNHASPGYTLLDLCCALAISGAVLAVSLPSLGSFSRMSSPERRAKFIAAELSSLSTLAIAREADMQLVLSSSGYRVETGTAPPRLFRRLDLLAHERFVVGQNTLPVVFRRNGSATPRSFQLRGAADGVCTFTVSLRSRVRFFCSETG